MERLTVIAQPTYGSKLRYRSDYDNNSKRLGALGNKNSQSSYQGPAIFIPNCYLDLDTKYYIRVCLTTIPHNTTYLRYFHPYELENPRDKQFNDKNNNCVWFPILDEDRRSGTKSFCLRIVKQCATTVKNKPNLDLFDYQDQNLSNASTTQSVMSKDPIKEYSLDRSQLSFTVAREQFINGTSCLELIRDSTVFSEEMVEGVCTDSPKTDDISSPLSTSSSPSMPTCQIDKYAPKYGYHVSDEDMIICLKRKLDKKTCDEFTITFECDYEDDHWSETAKDVHIQGRFITLKTPIFPYDITGIQSVDITLKLNNHKLTSIKYHYLTTFSSCCKCQPSAFEAQMYEDKQIPNQSPVSLLNMDEFDMDHMVPNCSSKNKLQSLPLTTDRSASSTTSSDLSSLPSLHLNQQENEIERLIDVLGHMFKQFFVNNDINPLLRFGRSFIKKNPMLLHDALDHNPSDSLVKLIAMVNIDTLRHKNNHGESFVLHAIRRDRVDIIQVLLEKETSTQLMEDLDEKRNNIFHLVALHSESSEIADSLIDYLLKNSISIQKKFDQVNQDYQTPLQLAICKKNLPVTKSIWKYSNTKICERAKRTGDNLIHLAVRNHDLIMVKYLIEEVKLIEQINQFNLSMTPIELAKSLKQDDIAEYLKQKYPQPEINDDDDEGEKENEKDSSEED